MSVVAFVVFNGLLLCAAISDIRRFRIPNAVAAAVLLSALVCALPSSMAETLSRGASLVLVASICGALWLRGLIGGGDLKLIVACAAWIPFGGLALFILSFGLASAIQGGATLAYIRVASRTPLEKALRSRLPYGVSIATAGLVWSTVSLLTSGS